MKIAIITDTHLGVRNDSLIFIDYFKKFYKNVFFPYLDANGIDTVIHLGDLVDRRKYINFVTAKALHEDFIAGIVSRNIRFHITVGNHDVTYKNTNSVNAVTELYGKTAYGFDIITGPCEREFDGLKVLMLPWINDENKEATYNVIKTTNAQVAMGHLEIKGFEMFRGQVADHGQETTLFDGFDVVLSGHYHHRSTNGNIFYLGAPYEMTWADFNDPRGFSIFDTETRDLTFIQNPYVMFKKFFYDDDSLTVDDISGLDYSDFTGHYVKVIVRNKNNPYLFDTLIGLLEKAGAHNVQVVDDNFKADLESDEELIDQAEDTITTISNYIRSLGFKTEPELLTYFQTLYSEALQVE